MADQAALAAVLGALAGAGITALVLVVRRLVRGSRELGTNVEHATYRTLHLASAAAEHLRSGLGASDVERAAHHLRPLLGCTVLALADTSGTVHLDGASGAAGGAGGAAALVEAARGYARQVTASGRAVVEKVPRAGPALSVIAVPVVTDGVTVGAVLAFSDDPVRGRRAPLIRATKEVAGWVAAQLRLGELDASRAALAEAQLRALRAQISPHFIYNALTAIASFITTDPVKARELVLDFADFTRYSFRRQGDFTTVAEELRSINSYLVLERARFGERLELTLRIAPETLSTVIPFLSVQPLVENAVRHGLERLERGGRISITAAEAGTDVEIVVEDDGTGIDPDEVIAMLDGRRPDHVGLRNVDTRLRSVYGDAYGLVVETAPDAGTLVRLRVPRSQPEPVLAPTSGASS